MFFNIKKKKMVREFKNRSFYSFISFEKHNLNKKMINLTKNLKKMIPRKITIPSGRLKFDIFLSG